MKRILSTLLTFALIAGCCACNRSGSDDDTTKASRSTKKTTVTTTETEDTDTSPSEESSTSDTTIDDADPSTSSSSKRTAIFPSSGDGSVKDSIASDSDDSSASSDPSTSDNSDPSTSSSSDSSRSSGSGYIGKPGTITDLTMFICDFAQRELNPDNEIRELIAQETGVRVYETYIAGMTTEEAVDTLIASGQYPDLIDGGAASAKLYINQCLVPWDSYLEDPQYANLRNYYSDKEWEMFRQDDGHIYWCNCQNNNYMGKSAQREHNGLAFWIQVRVLEWAEYPLITTLDEYFQLLEAYYEANPKNKDGTDVIPYTALCEDWRYFSLEAAPQMLDGHMFEGNVMVNASNPQKPVIESYDITDTAKRYYQKLNEEYQKGIVDPNFDSQTFDEYTYKLASGAVLGFCDEWWDFAYTVNTEFKMQGFSDLGYDYVPLGITIDPGMKNHWDYAADTAAINNASGVAVTTSCKDPDLAFRFMNRILEEDMHDLRMWGIENVDYKIDNNGIWVRNDRMHMLWQDTNYLASHVCRYSYLPHYYGYKEDGKNTMHPEDSLSKFFSDKSQAFIDCCNAYGYRSYRDFLRSEPAEAGPWYPIYRISNALTSGAASRKQSEIIYLKHEYLPQLVTTTDFDLTWQQYLKAYIGENPDVYFDYLQQELDNIMKDAG